MEYSDNFNRCITGLVKMDEPSLKTINVNGTQLHYMVSGDNNR